MGVNWMKTGAESAKIADKDKAEAEAKKAAMGNTWRFFLKQNEEARITFVDGDLVQTDVGMILGPPRFYEHNLQINGTWGNTFVCPEKTVPEEGHKCPICAAGDRPSLVALFTIIDHREFTDKNGNVRSHQKRLLVAKPGSMEQLTKIAQKRGGLAGCTFDVSRMGDQSAAIGSMFDFVEKNAIADLQATFQHEVEVNGQKTMTTFFTPVDYLAEIQFKTPEQLAQLGVAAHVKTSAGPGAAPAGKPLSPGGFAKKPGTSTNYSQNL
jgi:hypothetical protein